MARLKEKFQSELAGEIQKKLGLKNRMEVPQITKITLNMGVGEAVADKKIMEKARDDMEKISGQRPVTTLARKSVAGFKIRDGMPIGCKVTLRRERMYEFLDRLVLQCVRGAAPANRARQRWPRPGDLPTHPPGTSNVRPPRPLRRVERST